MTASDYKTGITLTSKPLNTKIVEVINTAPTVSFDVQKTKPVDILIFTDYTGEKLDSLSSIINAKKAQLNAIGVDANFVIINTSKILGTQTLDKYRYTRNIHFNILITAGSGTNGSVQPPEYRDMGGLWEETISYDKPLNQIPMNNNYLGYQYIKTNTYYNGYGTNVEQYYDIYGTQGTYNCHFFTEYHNPYTGGYYEYTSWSVDSVYADSIWKKDIFLGTDTFNVTSVDLAQIFSKTLRAGSDRYAILLSDAKYKYYSSGFGNGFAFGSLNNTVKDYIKQNDFKIYSVMDPKAMNTLINKTVISDMKAAGDVLLYSSNNGDYYFYLNNSGTSAYITDSSSFGQVKGLADCNLVLMSNGTTKIYTAEGFKTFPVNNVVASCSLHSAQIAVASSNGVVYIVDLNTLSIKKTFNIANVTSLSADMNTPNSKFAIHVSSLNGAYDITDLNYDGIYDTLTPYLSGYSLKKLISTREALFGLTTDGRLLRDNRAGLIDVYATNVNEFQIVNSTEPNIINILVKKADGSFMASYPVVIGQKWSSKYEDWIYIYGQGPLVPVAALPGASISDAYWLGSTLYVLGSNNTLYATSNNTNYYTSDSNVSSIGYSNDYSKLIIFYNNDNVKVRYGTNSYITFNNVNQIKVTNTANFVLYNDGTDNCQVLKDNITLYNPNDSYITVNELVNNCPDSMIYGVGQYSQALDHLVSRYTADTSYSTNYVLIGDKMVYSLYYQDIENDLKYRDYWKYIHDPFYFDNNLGTASFNNQTLTSPITNFDKTGRYLIDLKVRDNPKDDNNFDIYRLYNEGIVNYNLYVHRKPVALQKITIQDNGNGTYTVRAYDAGSYDLDHSVSRSDKGIVAREWRWRESNETSWHTEQMNKNDCTPDKVYITQLRVKDVEGVWSDWNTIEIDKNNPPVALFNIDKPLIATGEYLKVKDRSYPQSFSSIVKWHWIVKKLNADGSVPSSNIQNAQFANSNTGTGSLAGYDVNVKTDFSNTGPGTYRIYLRVKDSNGLWSDSGTDSTINLSNFYSRDITVDSPPVAQFTVNKDQITVSELLQIKDTSYKTGVTDIDRWHWIVKKLNADGSVPSSNLQSAQFADSNNGTGLLSGYDANVKTNYSGNGPGTYRVYLRVRNGSNIWSDGGTDGMPNLANCFYRDIIVKTALEISNVKIEGYWNHWRGQIDMFGKQLTNEPHRFLSLEEVRITADVNGGADKLVIRFSPELESMYFTDPMGNVYSYYEQVGYIVSFPDDTTVALDPSVTENSISWEYILPLAPSTVGWDDVRKRPPYSMTITVWKGSQSVTYTIDDIDITGNTYNLIYMQPVK